MEYQIQYRDLSEEARRAWETLSGLPLTTREQHRHAWSVLRASLRSLADDPHPSLHVIERDAVSDISELYVTGRELAALRVMIAWFKANDRAGRMRDLPVYPDLVEAIVSQLGESPWPSVWEPRYLDAVSMGGTLVLRPRAQAEALAQLLTVTLGCPDRICPSWPETERVRLLGTLADLGCWIQAMLAARDHEAS